MKKITFSNRFLLTLLVFLVMFFSPGTFISCSSDSKQDPTEQPKDKDEDGDKDEDKDDEIDENAVDRDGDGVIRILAIGNSFSQDAVEQYLYELAEAEGFKVVIGNAYIGGCSLEKHLKNAYENLAEYEYRKIVNGSKSNKSKVTMHSVITDEKWDYISMQQVSGNSGMYETWAASLPTLSKYVENKATNKGMKMMLHQTWAYVKTWGFPEYYKNQENMYATIVDAVNRAAQLVDIDIVIPAGTAIQNGRTSYLGDTFTRDGYHLEVTYGRYTAACTWFEKIFKVNVVGNSYAPASLNASVVGIAQNAAHAAVMEPNKVTVLKDYINPPVGSEEMKAPIFIDFGSSSSPAPWNNFAEIEPSDKGRQLIDADGDHTKFTVRVSKPFTKVYGGTGGEPAMTVNLGVDMPKSAYADGLQVGADGVNEGEVAPGELKIGNLDPSLEYDVLVYGLRWNSSVTRTTNYKITGTTTSNHTLAVGTKSNDEIPTRYVTATNILPDDKGEISIEVSLGEDNIYQGIIGAIRINVSE